MHIVRVLIVKELQQALRDPRMLFVMFVSPLIQLFLFGVAVTNEVQNVALSVADLDHSRHSRQAVHALERGGYFRLEERRSSADEAMRDLEMGRALVALVIPPDFHRKIMRGESPRLQVLVDGSQGNTSNVALGYAMQILSNEGFLTEAQQLHFASTMLAARMQNGAGADGGAIQTSDASPSSAAASSDGAAASNEDGTPSAQSPQNQAAAQQSQPRGSMGALSIPRVQLQERLWYNPDGESRNFLMPGIITLVLSILTLLLTAMGVTREKESGAFEQLIVSPITPLQLALGKTLPFALVGFVVAIIVTALSVFVYHIPLRGSNAALATVNAIYVLGMLGLGLFVSSVSSSQQQAMLTVFAFLFPAILLSDFFFPMDNMPEPIQILGLINPMLYSMQSQRLIFQKGAGFAEILNNLVALSAFAVAFYTFGVLRFRAMLR